MSTLCWNCRGLGNPGIVRRLRKWSLSIAPDLVFISKTMISKEAAEKLKENFGFSNAIGVAIWGRSGGLCLYWNEEDTAFSLTLYCQNHICGDVTRSGITWRFVGIYGWPDSENKYRTWKLIEHLCEEAPGPIIFGGDFNELLSYEEKAGGVDRERNEIVHFREMVDTCELRDLDFEGQWWTWERGNIAQTCVKERLDRYLASVSWLNLFPQVQVEHLLRYSSDHSPIQMHTKTKNRERRKHMRSFKFETAWLLDESCEEIVRESWAALQTTDLICKLNQLGGDLLKWSKIKFNDLGRQINEAEKQLREVQCKPITSGNCEHQAKLEAKLDDLHSKHEAYWYLRSQVLEVRDGDRNTSYFHQKATQRKRRNWIKGLYDKEGYWQEDERKVEEIICNFYSGLFSTNSPAASSINEVLQHMLEVITAGNNEALLRPYTKEECTRLCSKCTLAKHRGQMECM